MTTRSFLLAVAAIALLAVGCNNNDGTFVKPVGRKTADELNAEHSRFENSEDPPLTADTRFAAGQLAESSGAPLRAAEQYEEALRINPKYSAAAYRLGVVYAQARDYPKAIAAWENYITLTNGS